MATISVSNVSDGETIDASDLNNPINTIVNEINGGLDNNNIASSAAIAISKISPDSDTSGGIWWEELGRTTLGSAGDNITVSSLPARKYLKFFVNSYYTGTNARNLIRFNGDTGNNYSSRIDTNNGSAATQASAGSGIIGGTFAVGHSIVEGTIINVASQQKLLFAHEVLSGGADATTAPVTDETAVKWNNTSDLIESITIFNGGTGDFDAGSELVVLGHN